MSAVDLPRGRALVRIVRDDDGIAAHVVSDGELIAIVAPRPLAMCGPYEGPTPQFWVGQLCIPMSWNELGRVVALLEERAAKPAEKVQ